MTVPAVQRLREHFPSAQIAVLTQEKLADLWRGQPMVDSVLGVSASEGPWTIGRRLRTSHFQAAVVFPNSPRSALEPWWAGIPRRIGYASAWRAWLLTDSIASTQPVMRKRSTSEVKRLIAAAKPGQNPDTTWPESSHHVQHYLRLVARLGCDGSPLAPTLLLDQNEVDAVLSTFIPRRDRTQIADAAPPLLLGVNASAAYGPAKKWPLERFATVLRQVSARAPHTMWFAFGATQDWQLNQDLARLSGADLVNLAGKTTLRQLMALLKSCRAVLTNDSGPMHLAAALGVPVVAMFGSTSPELTGPGWPGDTRHHVLRGNAPCSPCFRRVCPADMRCMTQISVEDAAAALIRAVGDSELAQ